MVGLRGVFIGASGDATCIQFAYFSGESQGKRRKEELEKWLNFEIEAVFVKAW